MTVRHNDQYSGTDQRSGNDNTDGKALVRRFYAALDGGDPAALGELLGDNYRLHLAGLPETLDMAGFQAFGRDFSAAFPDLAHTIHTQVAEGDRVVTHLSFRGTHRGEFQGIPATNATVDATAMNIHRVSGGRLAEQWAVIDQLTLLRQLGAVT